jgi:hypothetical protein
MDGDPSASVVEAGGIDANEEAADEHPIDSEA